MLCADDGACPGPGDGTPLPGSAEDTDTDLEAEGIVHIETEGVVPRYMYKMQLAVGILVGRHGPEARQQKQPTDVEGLLELQQIDRRLV